MRCSASSYLTRRRSESPVLVAMRRRLRFCRSGLLFCMSLIVARRMVSLASGFDHQGFRRSGAGDESGTLTNGSRGW
jgi:hypothetical protein